MILSAQTLFRNVQLLPGEPDFSVHGILGHETVGLSDAWKTRRSSGPIGADIQIIASDQERFRLLVSDEADSLRAGSDDPDDLVVIFIEPLSRFFNQRRR